MSRHYAMGHCVSCGRTYTFDMDFMPVLIKKTNLCEPCLEKANEFRVHSGKEVIEYDQRTYPDRSTKLRA